MMANEAPRPLLQAMFDAAIASAQPEHCVPRLLPEPPAGRTVVIGAGPTLTNVNDFRAILITGDAATPTLEG